VPTASDPRRTASAYYWAPIDVFLSTPPAEVLGRLAAEHSFPTLEVEQREAWAPSFYDETYEYLASLGFPQV
jgi:hypothetical protein